MKNLLFSIVLMCFSLLVTANQTITVGGTVTDENTGLAVPDQMVFLYTDSTANNPGYLISFIRVPTVFMLMYSKYREILRQDL
jgi:hypothetical protein